MLKRLKAWLTRRSHRNAASEDPAVQAELPPVALHPFVPSGNCARCGFNRNNDDLWRDAAQADSKTGVCLVRGFDIVEPLSTYCKNFESRDHAPFGAVFSILPGHGNLCVPWVELAVPRESAATCCICGRHAEPGIALALPDAQVEACGPEHYLDWWTDYERRRLAYFKLLGEKAYSDMYDVVFSGATAHYSDAKEAFYSAISTARDLELTDEMQALHARLDHIKNVFRHQFK
jgi:hypothetical protein